MKKIILLASILMLTFSAWADEPPSCPDFTIVSSNGEFLAEIKAVECLGGVPVSEVSGFTRQFCEFKLSVLRKDDNHLLWSCRYIHLGYGGGTLSNDGSTFISIDPWYFGGDGGIFIYQNGELKKTITGRELKIDETKLIKTVSHELWLDKKALIEGENKLLLKLFTVDGQEILIDLKTFEIQRVPKNNEKK